MTTEKVTTSEELQKSTKNVDDKKEAVVTTPFSKEILFTTEKVTTSEEVDKGTKHMDYMKEAVVTIRRKYLDNF